MFCWADCTLNSAWEPGSHTVFSRFNIEPFWLTETSISEGCMFKSKFWKPFRCLLLQILNRTTFSLEILKWLLDTLTLCTLHELLWNFKTNNVNISFTIQQLCSSSCFVISTPLNLPLVLSSCWIPLDHTASSSSFVLNNLDEIRCCIRTAKRQFPQAFQTS